MRLSYRTSRAFNIQVGAPVQHCDFPSTEVAHDKFGLIIRSSKPGVPVGEVVAIDDVPGEPDLVEVTVEIKEPGRWLTDMGLYGNSVMSIGCKGADDADDGGEISSTGKGDGGDDAETRGVLSRMDAGCLFGKSPSRIGPDSGEGSGEH